MEFSESQVSLDNSIVVSPPEDEKSSFASPRVQQKAVRVRPPITALNSATNLMDNSSESIEQKYLKKRIEERPQHNPHLPKDVQLKSIILKSQQPYDEVHENKERISHLAEEEERVERLKKMNENESGNTLVLERGVPMMVPSHLMPLHNEYRQKSSRNSRRSNSADSEHSSDLRRKIDSQDSNRSETLYGMKGKADGKAMKKIEWLENYVELRLKQNVPLNGPELERYRQVLEKLSGVESTSTNVISENTAPVTVQQTDSEPKPQSVPPPQTTPISQSVPQTQLPPNSQSKPETKPDEAIKIAEELEAEYEHEDVSSLQKQLTEAKREIEKLRLERALLHAKSEIKKLKTEITYGQQNENEEINIDKIIGDNVRRDSPRGTTLSPQAPATSSRESSSSPRISSSGPKSNQPAKSTRNTLLKMNSLEGNPQRKASPHRSTVRSSARGTKMGLKGIGGAATGENGQTRASNRWSTISRRVSTQGSEALLEEDELEEYREEKRKRKKKKKFLQDIEDNMISRDVSKTKANPQVLKQMQSFDFLNFLDSLDGLEGNTLKKKSEE
mmetsp:Transcript_33185/g.61858  ORF Transcript_33185/g.61858 Transcript_33185/m.61858 type:complete len:561 (-) Transcript_33185:409-2091(-)